MSDHIMDGAEPTYEPGEAAAGVVLIHDLSGTPQIFHELSDHLVKAGFAADALLLPGHGTELADLDDTTWDDWMAAAQLVLDEMASRTGPVVVCGIGLGAALGCFVAAQHPSVQGIVAINPRAIPVPRGAIETLQAMLADGCRNVPPLGPDVSDRTIHVVEYQTVPVSTLISMFEALEDMSEFWTEVTCPLLIVTSARDHRVSPYNADWLADRVSGRVERLTLENSFHLAPIDVDKAELEDAIVKFVENVIHVEL